MNLARDSKGKRIAVLRPENAELAIQRLAEWNKILDDALDEPHVQARAKNEAKEAWVAMLKEQRWTYLGWLGDDTTAIVHTGEVVGEAKPGDLHLKEPDFAEFLKSSSAAAQ